MTTQDNENKNRLEISFNEYKEDEGGFFSRSLVWQGLLMAFRELEAYKKANDTDKEKEQRIFIKLSETQFKLQEALFERCNEPDKLTQYLDTLPPAKVREEIQKLLIGIGYLNPAPKNS